MRGFDQDVMNGIGQVAVEEELDLEAMEDESMMAMAREEILPDVIIVHSDADNTIRTNDISGDVCYLFTVDFCDAIMEEMII